MIFGPFTIGAPLALLGLIALPVIWWLLRATPPRPVREELPSLRLLEGVSEDDTTPARTPWYVLLLRLLAAALAILGLSLPVWSPQAKLLEGAPSDPFLIVIDDGWTSAPRWSEMIDAAEASLVDLPRDTGVHILTTADRPLATDPAQRFSRTEAEQRLKSLEPAAWTVDRASAAERLEASGLEPARVLYVTDGIETEGRETLTAQLSQGTVLSVRVIAPRGAFALTGVSAAPGGAAVEARRLLTTAEGTTTVSARTLDLTPVASAPVSFEAGAQRTEASFTLPTAALNRIGVFTLAGTNAAGATWLWDSTAKRQRVGLVSPRSLAQPLLEDVYYVRKALEPFAEVTEGPIEELIPANPDAIVLTDSGPLAPAAQLALENWIERGGALIVFAGPRLAAQEDPFVPVPLRRASRSLGGTLNWDTPQSLDAFDATSPFAGLPIPENAKIRQQVLAQPSTDLNARTWARLTDGSPVVTADARGEGTLILFHVTAGPEWSDLPLTGLFVEMLRRAIAAGRGEPVADDSEGTYAPLRVLDGFGRLTTPGPDATPIAGSEFFATPLSAQHPPGLYQGPAGIRARNAAAGFVPRAIAGWPSSAILLGDVESISRPLAGPLLVGALLLLAIDLAIALWVAGRFRGLTRATAKKASTAAAFALACLIFLPAPSDAQLNRSNNRPQTTGEKFEQAARTLRLAYIETGDPRTDELARAGLRGLSQALYWRTTVEPDEPHSVNLETDVLEVYPVLFYFMPDSPRPFSTEAMTNLNRFIQTGGVLIIDTRVGGGPNVDGTNALQGVMNGLDVAGLVPVPQDHVIRRTFYILDGFPGRFPDTRVWIEDPRGTDGPAGDVRQVSRVIIGSADWASAWAIDTRGRPLRTVDGGERQRELAKRVGINFMIYAMTGTYKDDQVHIPELLERLGEDRNRLPARINDGGDVGGPQ